MNSYIRYIAVALALVHTVGVAAAREKPSKHVSGVGVVNSIDADARRIRIDHGEIKGFMEAIVMEYPVARSALLRGIKPGDKVRFTIVRRNGTIARLEVSGRPK